MDKELKAKWVAALRGGTYQQTTGTLRKEEVGFCCLGVLLDVSARGCWRGDEYHIERDGDKDLILSVELESYASEFGLTNNEELTLIRMNDGNKMDKAEPQPFLVIADYIERTL